MKRERLFNLRVCAVIFASLVLGIAFSVNTVAGIIFFFVLLALTLSIFLKPRKVCYIIVILVAYLTGFLYASGLNWANEAHIDYPDDGYIIGTIDMDSRHNIDGSVSGKVVIDDVTYNGERVKGKCTLYLPRSVERSNIHVGDELGVYGSLNHMDIDTSELGGSRDYTHGIRYEAYVKEFGMCKAGKLGFRDAFVLRVERVLIERVDEDTAGFLAGMMFGDTSLITDSVRSASKRLGIAHLFAVSGLHVGMIVGFFMLILSRTKLNKRWYLVMLPFIYFYAYMCGFSVSVIRATIMVTIFLMSKALFMRYDMLSSLALAGTIILLINPYYLFDVSFVMSFVAVLSIALFSDRIFKALTKRSERHKGIKTVLSANLAVNIGLLPIMLHLFGGVSLLTIPVNMLIIPIITAIFPVLFLIILFFIIVHAYAVVTVAAIPFSLIVAFSKAVSRLNFVSINFDVSWYFVVAYVIVMIMVSKYVFFSNRVKNVPKILLTSVLILSMIVPPIEQSIYGKEVAGSSTYNSYAVVYQDEYKRRILVMMGDVDGYLFGEAMTLMSHNSLGNVHILVVPSMTEDDIALVDEFNKSIGAERIMTQVDAVFGSAASSNSEAGIEITGDANVIISKNGTTTQLVAPNMDAESGYYDVVIAHNKDMKDDNFTSKYYTNFSKSSHGVTSTGFTFSTKNGKISLYRELE